jgi:hypothetical protein
MYRVRQFILDPRVENKLGVSTKYYTVVSCLRYAVRENIKDF